MQAKAALVVVRNPFAPLHNREVRDVAVGQSLAQLAPRVEAAPFILMRNGSAVLRADWQQPVAPGDIVAIVFLPRGGGGGGSNPLKIILSIAVAVFAPYVSTFVGAAFGTFGMTTATFMAVSNAVVGLVGSALVNAVAGGEAPRSTSALQAQAIAAPSPTYNLQAQGNMARLDAAIPVQYGRLMCFPDFAAQPYLEYAGNEQFLYQLLCIGAGEYDIEAIRIEDTLLSNWEEITSETIGPHGTVTLFPTNVETSIEVAGAEMTNGVALGPFTANDATTETNALGFDFVFPRGLYYANISGGLDSKTVTWTVEARLIDDDGDPLGSWTTLGSETYTAATTTPQRMSKRYSVTAGRYEVRCTRTNAKDTSTQAGHEIDWSGLRAYMQETRDFGDVTLLALRMRATNNLTAQASRKINVIATRKLPAWDGDAFGSNVATSSIAWALADACTNTTWGAGLANARVDLDGLAALDVIWASRGDEFNGRFDSAINFWEAITKIARAGRAYPFMQGGIIRFSRDAAQTVPVALYSMRNIMRGSFSVQYLTPSEAMADACDVSYFDDGVWAPRRVQAKLSGSSAAKPVKIEFFGITDRAQAHREGIYESACNRYRRKLIKFATEMEGFIPSFGDLIAVSHDMVQWGQGAEVVAWDAGALTLTLTEPMTFQGVADHYVALRTRGGGVDGPYVATAGATDFELVLSEAPSFTPYTGQNEERTHIVFGVGETWRQPARVLSVRPRGLAQVEIECVNEDPSVHTAEDGQTAPAIQTSQLSTRWTAPVVEGLTAWSMPGSGADMLLSWKPAPGADHYLIEQSYDGIAWVRTGEPSSAEYTAQAIYGNATLLRVAAVGLTRGPWVTIGYGGFADYMWNATSTDLMWSATATDLMWSY